MVRCPRCDLMVDGTAYRWRCPYCGQKLDCCDEAVS